MKIFTRLYELWLRLVGSRQEFSLEFRIYHAVLIIIAIGLAYNVEFKYYIGSIEGSLLALIFLFVNSYLYYISRFNKQMGNNVIIFSVAGSCLITANFFINAGINGPTLIYSAVYVLLVIAISPARQHRYFVWLNFIIVLGLIFFQFTDPGLFLSTYPNAGARYIDIASAYFFGIMLIYFTISYIRKNYAAEKISADEKARSIIEQQQFIVNQNSELANWYERFEYVTKATFDAIWDWDITKNELFWGKGYETIFGYAAGTGEMSNNFSLWQNRVHPADAKRVLKTLQAAIAKPDQHFWEEQYQYLKADNSYAYVVDRGYVIRDGQQNAIRIVGALQDITSLKEQEIRIINQNQKLQQIADINSHELRKPVATILGIIQLFKTEEIKDELNVQLFEYLKITTTELDDVIRRVAENAHEFKKVE